MSRTGCNYCKDLCEHAEGCGDPEREDMELIKVSHCKAKEFAVGMMDVHVEVRILHIESYEPGCGGREGMIWGRVTIRKWNLWINEFKIRIG